MRSLVLILTLLLAGCLEAPRPSPVTPPDECRCCSNCRCRIDPAPQPVTPPQPQPVAQGKRIAIVIHESSQQTPDFFRLRSDLTAGTQSQWLATKGHAVWFADQHDTSPIGGFAKNAAVGKTLPVLVVAELDGTKIGRAVLVESLRPDAIADNVVELIRRAGG